MWYRATVTNPNPRPGHVQVSKYLCMHLVGYLVTKYVQVHFVDYGDSEVVSLAQVNLGFLHMHVDVF